MQENIFTLDNLRSTTIVLEEWSYLYCYPAHVTQAEVRVLDTFELKIENLIK